MKRGIKHRHLPGDIPKAAKIALLEGHVDVANDIPSERRGIKAYRKRILMKERAVLKERFQKALDD